MGDALPPPPPPTAGPSTEPPGPVVAPGGTPLPPPPPASLTRPAGDVAHGPGPVQSAAQVSRIGRLTSWGTGLVAVAGVASVVSAVLLAPVITTASEFLRGDVSEADFEDAFVRVQLVQGLQSVIAIAAGVVTVVWMYRIASNLRAHSRGTTFAPALSVFAWILPPFLYVLPLLILRELWKASDPDATHGTDEWRAVRVDPLVWVWFVAYGAVPAVITAIVTFDTIESVLATGLTGGDLIASAQTLDDTGILTLVSGGLAAVAAIAWIVFARRLARRHMTLTGETTNQATT